MYRAFYRLSAKPFQLSPDPRFFFSSKGHDRAMAYLTYGMHQAEGFIVITGEIGAGKTTLARALAHRMESKKVVLAQVVSTQLEADDMLRMVAMAFGLPPENNKAMLLGKLEQFLLSISKQGKRALLVVDEAQNLPASALEELRMLSNFQRDERSLLQSFLLGQPEFRKTLQSPSMDQLRQRVLASCHLGPMSGAETEGYIVHRLKKVGWEGDPTFDQGAFAAIYQHTGGVPRRINVLCDRLLLMGSLEQIHAITSQEVTEVIDEFQMEAAPESSISDQQGED